jgi:hypothetical protein
MYVGDRSQASTTRRVCDMEDDNVHTQILITLAHSLVYAILVEDILMSRIGSE